MSALVGALGRLSRRPLETEESCIKMILSLMLGEHHLLLTLPYFEDLSFLYIAET